MGVKDLFFWAGEARRKMLGQQIDRVQAAMLPHIRPEERDRQLAELAGRVRESDRGEEISDLEAENEKLIAERKRHATEVLARRKARGEGKPKLKRSKGKIIGRYGQ